MRTPLVRCQMICVHGSWLVVTRRRSANKSPKKGIGVGSQMQVQQDRTSSLCGVMEGSNPTRHEVEDKLGQNRESRSKLLPSISKNRAQSSSFAIGPDSLDRDKGPSLQRISIDKGQSSSRVAQRKNLVNFIKGKKDFARNRAMSSLGNTARELQTQPLQFKQKISETSSLQVTSLSSLGHTNVETEFHFSTASRNTVGNNLEGVVVSARNYHC